MRKNTSTILLIQRIVFCMYYLTSNNYETTLTLSSIYHNIIQSTYHNIIQSAYNDITKGLTMLRSIGVVTKNNSRYKLSHCIYLKLKSGELKDD